MAFFYTKEFFTWTSKNKVSTAISSFSSYVDDSIRIRYHIEVMLDNKDRVSFLYESIEDIEEFLYVREMESRCGLIEDIKCFSC